MNSAILPPSASWYFSSILAYNDTGLVAYGSRNEIVFFRLNEGKSSAYECTFLQKAHTDRINCLVFSPNFGSFKNCIASCADDGFVKIWDVTTHELKFNHSGHKDSLKILGLDWSLADPKLVVSVNDQGSIVCFDLPSNTIRRLSAGQKILPLCLACCPHDKDIIAIGAKAGIIVIINIKGDGKQLFRVKGHEADVVSLSWCPVPNDVFSWDSNKKQNEKTLLLVSGGCDKCIYIWKAGLDMRYSSKLLLPIHPMGQTSKKKLSLSESSSSGGFICVRWVDPYQILSSSMYGELLSWDVRKIVSFEKFHKGEKKRTSKMVQPRILHSVHTKGLFSIACQISSERNIESKQDNRIAYTIAVDRHLVLCNIGSGETILDIPCAGSIIYCIVVSPDDPNRLAIGTGDGKILIWDMGTKVVFKDVYVHWKKINGKVMALAWHPTDCDIIAFGTADGRIGLFQVCTDTFPTIFKLYHHRAVYTLVWAPPIILTANTKQTNLALFSVGDKELVQYCRETPDKDPVRLEKLLKDADIDIGLKTSQRTDVAFKYDFSVFAVANDNGSVHILSCEDQSRLHTLYPHKKGINSLVWHPPSVYSDSNSPYKNWLASGAESIKVFNIPVGKDLSVETIASFTSHVEKIASLAWSPHFNAQLISASYDSTVQVWDVLTQAPIATYQNHNSAVLCAIWSPLDPDLAISGSYDNTLQVWHVSKQTIAPPGKQKLPNANLNKARLTVPLATELSMIKPSSSKPSFWTPNTSINSSFSEERLQARKNRGLEDYNKRVRARSFFPVTSSVLQNPKHLNLLYKRVLQSKQESASDSSVSEEKILMNSVKDNELDDSEPDSLESTAYLDYFGDKKAMRRLLLLEDTHLKGTGNYFNSQHNALWRGEISQMLEEATKKKQLSDWLVVMSKLDSNAVFAETCVAYAAQLTDCGEYIKAASYLLAVHKVEEAILLLAENHLYKEALAIAKSRYPEDDPTITMVLQNWGKYSSNNGQLLLGAHCFLAAEDYHSASEVLVRCHDLKSLKFAAVMAKEAGSLERAETLMKECLQIGLQHGNYKIVEDIIAEKSEYQAWSLWLEACHIVNFMKKNKKNCEEHQLSWLRKECTAESILDKMKPVCERVGEEYINLNKYVINKLKMPSSDKELWYVLSGHIAILCAAYHNTGRINSTTLQSFVSALSTAYQFQTTYDLGTPLLQLCYFFSPQGPFSSNSIFMSPCETEKEKLLMKSARAFLCAGIVHWLINSKSIKETILNKSVEDENEISEAKETSREVSDIKQIDWLVELLEKCQVDVFDAESFCFFKTKTQKQMLLDSAARDKAEKNKMKRKKENKMNSERGNSMEGCEGNLGKNNEDADECEEKINGVEEEKNDRDTENSLDNNISKNKDIFVEENGAGDIGSKLNKNESKASTSYLMENGSGDGILLNSKETDPQLRKNNVLKENYSDNTILQKKSIKPKTDNQETSAVKDNSSDDNILVNTTESDPQSEKTTVLKENGLDDIILQKQSIKLKAENTEVSSIKENGSNKLISLVDHSKSKVFENGDYDSNSKIERSVCVAVIKVPEHNKSTNPDVLKLADNLQEFPNQIMENGKKQINNRFSEAKDEQIKENINLNNLEGCKNSNTNEELEKMDSFLSTFYESRVSAPNPFVACSNIKCVINYYVKELSADLAKELDEKCDYLWKSLGK